ncbi:MAG: hypothetical protein GF401_06295 [Chitinivibrionales bacterium]|nr:hypothetical protein [Chitinivibrionales bacterium]
MSSLINAEGTLYMIPENPYFLLIIQAFILLLGISLGRSILLLKIRKEENKKKEIELAILSKRSEVINEGKKVAHNLEELLYNAQVRKEIDDIIRKDGKG